MLKILAVLALSALMLASCGSKYDQQMRSIASYFGLGKTGSSPDYYLVKLGFAGRERVAVVFGFVDDQSFCLEIASLYMQRYPGDSYSCEKAND